MKLELKHLAPYLPYELKYFDKDSKKQTAMRSISTEIDLIDMGWGNAHELNEFKPILRPLSDLTKDKFKLELYQYYETLGIDVKLVNYDSGNDNPFDMTLTVTYKMMGELFTDVLINRGSTSYTPFHVIEWLYQNHFDVSNLIPNGLAIDINTI